jgi:hypothetical protein
LPCLGAKRTFLTMCFLLIIALLVLPRASALPTVTTAYSTNWSGYVAMEPSPYTSVSAGWTVPSVSATSAAYSAVWVGIGGADRRSYRLLQAGTEQDIMSNGTAVYYAWHEVYPRLPVLVSYVSVGDSISVSISQVRPNASGWRILIFRNSAPILNLTVNLRPNPATEATAEFIVERPSVGATNRLATLADYGNVTFSDCTTSQGPLSSLTSVSKVIMTSNSTNSSEHLSEPGPLDEASNSFSLVYSAGATAADEFSISTPVLVLALITSFLALKLISRNEGRGKRDSKNRSADTSSVRPLV